MRELDFYKALTAKDLGAELNEFRDAKLEKLVAEAPAPEPSPEERITALEQDNAELRDALEALLSGVAA